jgi:C-terminal peptidase prc
MRTSICKTASRLLVPFAVLIATACAGTAAPKTSPAPSESPLPAVTPIPAAPTPDTAALLRDGGVAIVRNAYDRLLDEYIDPVDERSLLSAAWDAAAEKARTAGADVPPSPRLTGDRGADLAAFSDGYVRMTSGMADTKPVRYAAVDAMARTLHDCHTFFLAPVASETLLDARAGHGVVGIGIELAGVPPLVTEVIPGGPADRAGLIVGDRVFSIDGTDATSFGPAAAFDRINGDEGTRIELGVKRADGSGVDVAMQRERVVSPNVESRLIGDTGVGYVRVREFVDGGVAEDLRRTLAGFEAGAVKSWILDIRDNPGGRLDVPAISLFVKDGVVVRDRGRGGTLEAEQATGAVLPAVRPMVLLTNNRTGSVAEAFAAALQDYHAAHVLGATTNGCVGFTDVSPLGDGSSFAVTTHVNLGPVTQKALNGVGVIPDEPVGRSTTDIAAGRDPQLDAAVAYLRSTAS